MRIEKECACCGAVYTVAFTSFDERVEDPKEVEDSTEDTEEDKDDMLPEFCPFCGHHESDEPEESD